MRLTIVAALLSLASPVVASDEVPPQARYGIEALVAARYVIDKCPSYRVDQVALVSIMMKSELTADDMAGRYSTDMHYIDDKARLHEGMTDQQFCDMLFRFYQAEGTDRHLIGKK